MKLKQTVAEWAYYRDKYAPAEYYRRLKEIGYVGVEMAAPERYAAVKAAGLKLINTFGTPTQDGLNRTEEHPRALRQIRQALATAQQHNIAQLIVFSGPRNDQPDDVGIRNCITALKQVAKEAERAGVVVMLEVFNKYDHAGYQADYSDYAFQVIKAVGSPAVKVLYDIYHMHRMGEDVAPVIVKNLELIAHLHIAGSPRRNFPGPDQEIDYASVIKKVLAAGYRGWWGQEFLPAGDSIEELTRAHDLFDSYVGN